MLKIFAYPSLLGGESVRGELPPEKEMYGTFLRLAWPSVIEAVLVGLVGVVDTLMVSTLGDEAIAAVGITQQPKFVLMCFLFALNVGITAVVARRKGEDNREGANHATRNGLLIGLVLVVILAFLGYRFAEPFLRLAGAKDDYIADAVTYFRIIAVSVIFQCLNGSLNAAQKGSGNTRISMVSNVIGNVVNIIFNYLLINGIGPFPRLEVKGAALATALGAFVSFAVSLSRLFQKKNYISFFCPAPWRPDRKVIGPIVKVASSALVEQLCMRAGFFIFNRIVADLSTLAYATHIACMNFLGLSFCCGDGFQVASTALAGQSLGAKRPDKAIIYCNIGQRVVFFVAVILSVTMVLLRRQIIGLYSSTPEVVEMGSRVLLFMAVITYIQTSQVIYTGCLRGAGDTRFTAITAVVSVGVVRPLMGYLLTYPVGWGLYGAWTAILLDQLCRLVMNSTRVRRRKWLQIKL
ncbi:MAG: MATE family efflux transporter [Lachnospiraceae bacterium]|nr:MATE family efflux transporter [Lachnospiraceae bacterium]